VVAHLLPLVENHPNCSAILDGYGTSTWADLNVRVNRLANALRAQGVAPADRLLCVMSNRREFFEVLLAARSIGVHLVPVSPHLTDDELDYILTDSGASVVVAEPAVAVADLTAHTSSGSACISIGGHDVDWGVDYEALLSTASADEPNNEILGGVVPYTSGTTGRPKGVVPRNGAVGGPTDCALDNLRSLARSLRQPTRGVALIMAPVYHMGPLGFSLLALAQGSTLHLSSRFDAAEMLKTIEQHRITALYAVPTHFARLLKLPLEVRSSFDLSSVQYAYHTGAPCPPELKLAMIDWWGPVIFEGYGASEAGMVGFCDSIEYVQHLGTVGRVLPTVEVVVVNDAGQKVHAGEIGDLYFRSRAGVDFEYLNDPVKSRGAHLDPGVFTFGDRGHVDDDGYLYLAGRQSEMVITGGVNVYPAEIENVLMAHPAVLDVAVLGEPDDDLGEHVTAVVELAEGMDATSALVEELSLHCRAKLARFKVPRRFEFIDHLPRTETGKVRKHLIRRDLAANL